jgi:hypothetical protein
MEKVKGIKPNAQNCIKAILTLYNNHPLQNNNEIFLFSTSFSMTLLAV